MDVNLITQVISNVGFPIACCIYLLWNQEKLRKTLDDNTAAIRSIEKMLEIYHGKGNE